MGNLAVFLRLKGAPAEAESLSVQSLEIYRKTVEEDHPQFAYGLNSVAMACMRRDDCADAAPLFRQAIDLQVRALGDGLWVPNAIRLNLGKLPHEAPTVSGGRAGSAHCAESAHRGARRYGVACDACANASRHVVHGVGTPGDGGALSLIVFRGK